MKWRMRSVATVAKSTPEELEYIKYYAPEFAADGKGLYYSRFPAPPVGKEISEPDHDCRVYFHALGTPTSRDVVIYTRPDHPSWQFEPTVTPDGHYLVLEIGDGEVGGARGEPLHARMSARAGPSWCGKTGSVVRLVKVLRPPGSG